MSWKMGVLLRWGCRPQCQLVNVLPFDHHALSDSRPPAFGNPTLLKRKASTIATDLPLPSPVQQLPFPPPCPHKCPHLGHEVLDHMKELLRVGSQ